MSHEAVNWAYAQTFPTGANLALRKFVLVTLCDHADEAGICWPSSGGIARKIGIARSTARRHLEELHTTHKLLHTEERPGTSNLIVLHLPSTYGKTWEAHQESLPGVAHGEPPTPVDNYPVGGSRWATTPTHGEPRGGSPGEPRGGSPGEPRIVMNRHESPAVELHSTSLDHLDRPRSFTDEELAVGKSHARLIREAIANGDVAQLEALSQ